MKSSVEQIINVIFDCSHLYSAEFIIIQKTLIWIERILETKMYWSVTVKSNSYQIMWVSSVGYLEFTTLWQYWLWHFISSKKCELS